MVENLSDLEIIELILKGQKSNFAVLVSRYQQAAYKLALGILLQKADAEDAVSDAFIKAYMALPGCRKDTNFNSWFLKITYNCCLDILRKRKKFQSFNGLEDTIELASDEDPLQDLVDREHKEGLWQALNKLNHEERGAVILKYYNEASYLEIARTLNWPMGTVASRLSRARDKLRNLMEGGSTDE